MENMWIIYYKNKRRGDKQGLLRNNANKLQSCLLIDWLSRFNISIESTLDPTHAHRIQFQLLGILAAWEEGELSHHHDQSHLGLQEGKPHANARPRSLTKCQECVGAARCSGFLGEVVGVELSRVGVVFLIILNT